MLSVRTPYCTFQSLTVFCDTAYSQHI